MCARKLKVVFDFDGVLNDLVGTACEICGINYADIDEYELKKVKALSEDNRKKLIEAFSDVKTFEKSGVSESITELKMIENIKNVEVYIHSLCWSEEIAQFKRNILKHKLPWLPEERVILNIKGVESEKDASDFADILVEDCIANIIRSKPKMVGILIKKPYNSCTKHASDIMNNKIMIADDLESAIDIALWRLTYEGGEV